MQNYELIPKVLHNQIKEKDNIVGFAKRTLNGTNFSKFEKSFCLKREYCGQFYTEIYVGSIQNYIAY